MPIILLIHLRVSYKNCLVYIQSTLKNSGLLTINSAIAIETFTPMEAIQYICIGNVTIGNTEITARCWLTGLATRNYHFPD